MRLLEFLAILFFFSLYFTCFLTVDKAIAAYPDSLIIDNNSVALFDQIPDSYINLAAAQKILFFHASVGGNIYDALIRLQKQNSKYNIDNFIFETWPVGSWPPSHLSAWWQLKISHFQNEVAVHFGEYNNLSMKFCFADVWKYIPNPPGSVSPSVYIESMTTLQNNYPNNNIIWWTLPVTIGDPLNYDDWALSNFNITIREYFNTSGYNLVLFDLADIESDGGRCFTTDGTYEGVCPEYTNDGGHPNELGADRVAKAFWVMMSRLAGWPGVEVSPYPSTSPNPSCQVDVSGNNIVDADDIKLVSLEYGFPNPTEYDFDLNNLINAMDLSWIVKWWGDICQ